MIPNPKARELTYVPTGYRGLGRCMYESMKAYLFEYYGQELWISKKAVIKAEGGYWAPKWAIESAKKFAEQKTPVIRR